MYGVEADLIGVHGAQRQRGARHTATAQDRRDAHGPSAAGYGQGDSRARDGFNVAHNDARRRKIQIVVLFSGAVDQSPARQMHRFHQRPQPSEVRRRQGCE